VSPETTPKSAHAGVIAVAVGVMNVATYGYTILAARLLKPGGYGAFAAVMNLLLVVGVVQLALQATAARRISTAPGDVTEIEGGVRRLTFVSAAGLGALLLALTPVINDVLKLHSVSTALLVGLTAVPLTLMGGIAAFLLWRANELIAVFAVFLSALAPVAVGAWALRSRLHRQHHERTGDDHSARALAWETGRNSAALLGFFALSNLDVVVARNTLETSQSGLYAAGLILTKAVLFLPQFVVVLAFPDMAESASRRRTLRLSLLLVGVLGAVGVLASWALQGVALIFVGGADYTAVKGDLWAFAVLGTLLSMIQLLVYALLARERSWAQHWLWLGLAALFVFGRTCDSFQSLVRVVAVVDAVMFVLLLLPALLRKDDGTEPVEAPAPADSSGAADAR